MGNLYFSSINERVITVADYIIDNNSTVRQAGQYHGVSKSTVHSDMATRLSRLDAVRYCLVRDILDVNRAERHLRGGQATQKKYCAEVSE